MNCTTYLSKIVIRSIFLIFVILLTACGGGDGDTTADPNNNGDPNNNPDNSNPVKYSNLDQSFGSGGLVTFDQGINKNESANSMVVDSNGDIIIIGTINNAQNRDESVIWKYTNSGNLDNSFAGNGMVTVDQAGRLSGIILDSFGRILVVGTSGGPYGSSMAIWRYNVNGALDTAFGESGVVTYDSCIPANVTDTGVSIVTDTLGRIYVVGNSGACNNIGSGMLVWRLMDDGTPDTVFGPDGVNSYGLQQDTGNKIIIDSITNKILVLGNTRDSNGLDDFSIWRINEDGTLDNNFGVNGQVIYNDNSRDRVFDIAQDPQGRIYVTADKHNPSTGAGFNMALYRLDNDGSLDTNFANNGVAVYDSVNDDYGWKILIDKDGSIYVIGQSYGQYINNPGMKVWKFFVNGDVDTLFANNGVITYNSGDIYNAFSSGVSGGFAIDGDLFVVGQTYLTSDQLVTNTRFDMAIWRYE